MLGIPFASICKVTSFVNSFNPIPIIHRAIRTSDHSQLPTFLYPFNTSMQSLWALYGHKINNEMLFIVSFYLAFMQSVYTTVSSVLRRQYTFAIVFFTALGVGLVVGMSLSENILGTLASLIQTLAILSNLEIIFKAVKAKSSSFINLKSLMLWFPNAISWSLYSSVEEPDVFVFIPCFTDFLMVTAMGVLYMVYPKKPNEREQEKKQGKAPKQDKRAI